MLMARRGQRIGFIVLRLPEGAHVAKKSHPTGVSRRFLTASRKTYLGADLCTGLRRRPRFDFAVSIYDLDFDFAIRGGIGNSAIHCD